MALSEMGLSIGARRLSPRKEVAKTIVRPEPKPLYTQKEITEMMLAVPSDLTSERPIETPAGIWHMDASIAIFDSKSAEELDKITLRTKTETLKGELRRFLALT